MSYIQSFGNSLFSFLASVAVYFILLNVWLRGESLNLSAVYALFACIFVLFITVNSLTYLGTVALSNLSAILARFSTLYELKGKEENVVDDSRKKGLKINDAAFSWVKDKDAQISKINMEVRPGELAIVIGQVGSGKSTLLNSIMSETYIKQGSMDLNGRIAYVEQEPFIFSASIVDNILMGRDFDIKRFEYAIRVA